MKLILTQEVTGLGGPGDVVEVKDGYGRNYLVPRGLAITWTKGGEKQVAQIRRGREVREIAGALAVVAGEDLDRRAIALGNPIKTLGPHSVSVRLHDDVSATVALNVIPA